MPKIIAKKKFSWTVCPPQVTWIDKVKVMLLVISVNDVDVLFGFVLCFCICLELWQTFFFLLQGIKIKYEIQIIHNIYIIDAVPDNFVSVR